MKWTNEELDLLSKYRSDIKPIRVYEGYVSEFGAIRSYDSVQKKFRTLREDLEPTEPELHDEDDEQEDQTPYVFEKYKYIKEADEYWIPTKRGFLQISGSRIRQLVSDYSNFGAKKTRNVVAREFGWARDAVIDVLKVLGKTHDSAPFTDEVLLEEPVEELVASLVRKKEGRVIAKAERLEQVALEKNALKWQEIERTIKNVFADKDYQSLSKQPVLKLKKPEVDFDLVLYHTDAHVGKLAHGWNYDETRRIILETAERALAHATAYGQPNRIITGIGGDWANIDTPGHTTTRGTPQNSSAEWYDILDGANQITLDLLRLLRQAAPVAAYTVPGNHDRMWSMLAGSWLNRLFEEDDRVEVHTHQHRHYIESGKNLIMLTHGDGCKPREYPSIMAAESAEIWGRTKHRYVYHGHLHHEVVRESRGVIVTQMPSITPDDNWHLHSGYVGNRRALTAHVHNYEAGRVAQFNIAVSDDGEILG